MAGGQCDAMLVANQPQRTNLREQMRGATRQVAYNVSCEEGVTSWTCLPHANLMKRCNASKAAVNSSSLMWLPSSISLKNPAAGTCKFYATPHPGILASVNTTVSGREQMKPPTCGCSVVPATGNMHCGM